MYKHHTLSHGHWFSLDRPWKPKNRLRPMWSNRVPNGLFHRSSVILDLEIVYMVPVQRLGWAICPHGRVPSMQPWIHPLTEKRTESCKFFPPKLLNCDDFCHSLRNEIGGLAGRQPIYTAKIKTCMNNFTHLCIRKRRRKSGLVHGRWDWEAGMGGSFLARRCEWRGLWKAGRLMMLDRGWQRVEQLVLSKVYGRG